MIRSESSRRRSDRGGQGATASHPGDPEPGPLTRLATFARVLDQSRGDLEGLLGSVAEQVTRGLGCDTCAIMLQTADAAGEVPSLYMDGVQAAPVIFDRDKDSLAQLREVFSRSSAERVTRILLRHERMRAGAALLVPRLDANAARSWEAGILAGWLGRFPVRSLLAAPLQVGDRVVGAVVCARRQSDVPFGEVNRELLSEMADRTALRIENARLRAQLDDANAHSAVLRALTTALNAVDTVEDMFEPALEALCRQLRLDRCALAIFDSDRKLRIMARRGLSENFGTAVESDLRAQASGSPGAAAPPSDPSIVVEPAVPRAFDDVKSADEWPALRSRCDEEGIRALAVVPLSKAGELVGVFLLVNDERHRTFTPADLSHGLAVADQVAGAIVQKQNHLEHERLIGKLTQTVNLNDMFVGILGHDLRNPLGAILMSATILSRKVSDDGLGRTVRRILSAGERMNRMIAQLLDFTRVRSVGKLAIDPARADVAVIFRQAVDEISAVKSGRSLRFEAQGDTTGSWDPERLAQVAASLVGNAVGHGATGGEVSVVVTGDDPGCVTIEIRNVGTIPHAQLPLVFEPFQTVEVRDRRGGLGLDLFISKAIVTAHGGTLGVASAEGMTTFTIRLPRGGASTTLTPSLQLAQAGGGDAVGGGESPDEMRRAEPA